MFCTMEPMKLHNNINSINKTLLFMPNDVKDIKNAHPEVYNAYLHIQREYAMHYFKHIMDNINFYIENFDKIFDNLVSKNTEFIIVNYKEPYEELSFKSFYEQIISYSGEIKCSIRLFITFLWMIKKHLDEKKPYGHDIVFFRKCCNDLRRILNKNIIRDLIKRRIYGGMKFLIGNISVENLQKGTKKFPGLKDLWKFSINDDECFPKIKILRDPFKNDDDNNTEIIIVYNEEENTSSHIIKYVICD